MTVVLEQSLSRFGILGGYTQARKAGYKMMWGYFGGPWSWLGPIMMIVFWALVIGGIALLLRSWWTPARAQEPDSAQAILDRRYANGEISREEYQAMRQDLTGRSR